MSEELNFADDVQKMLDALESIDCTEAERYIFGDIESGKLMVRRIIKQISTINALNKEVKALRDQNTKLKRELVATIKECSV